MKRLDLQLFANEAVQGKKLVYLYRILSEAAKEDGTTLAFTTENGRTKSKDADKGWFNQDTGSSGSRDYSDFHFEKR